MLIISLLETKTELFQVKFLTNYKVAVLRFVVGMQLNSHFCQSQALTCATYNQNQVCAIYDNVDKALHPILLKLIQQNSPLYYISKAKAVKF